MEPISSFPPADSAGDWVKSFYEQAGHWWGAEPHQIRVDQARAATIEHFCGPGPKRILELGAGTGQTAAALADLGHTVLAVEFSPLRAALARTLIATPRRGSLTVLEEDFYTVQLKGSFDVVGYWDGFGVGTDADQRRLLRRIAREWLAPDGLALIDVFNPSKAARDDGSEERLDPLPGVPESVEMFRRCHFDPLACLWIDQWVPTAAPDKARAQTLRCYSPVDFALLLEGTGLALVGIDLNGTLLSLSPLGTNGAGQEPCHTTESMGSRSAGDLLDAWSYLALLRKA